MLDVMKEDQVKKYESKKWNRKEEKACVLGAERWIRCSDTGKMIE